MRAPFDVIEPAGAETPLVVEIPHAGLDLPAAYLEPLAAPVRAVARDADLYVDALYADAASEGATTLVARTSRYVVDVNRSERDVDGEVVEGARNDVRLHHGLVWRTTSDGEPALTRKLTPAELEERLDGVWRPYHRALAQAIERKRARFGIAVVLAAHSMPSVERTPRRGAVANENVERTPRKGALANENVERTLRKGAFAGEDSERTPANETQYGPDPRPPRADVVPGTRGRTSAAARFIDAVEAQARASGWTVRHDDPYAGGFTTQHYGIPAAGVHVVQVELARRLYLDEATLRPGPTFASVRTWCRALVAELGRIALDGGERR
jgi:N-formylglutamate deformylase